MKLGQSSLNRLPHSTAIASLCSELTLLGYDSLISAHLARVVLEHQRRLDHVRERRHLRVAEHQLEQREDAVCGEISKFPQNLRFRIKICGSKFAVKKTKSLSRASSSSAPGAVAELHAR